MTVPTSVALLALAYQELAKHPEPDPVANLEDIAVCPGELSWLGIASAAQATEADWTIMDVLVHHSVAVLPVAEVLSALDPCRAEAVLHATGVLPPEEDWALSFRGERWDAVEAEMQSFREDGLTVSHDDQDAIAVAAVSAATGAPAEAVIERWF